MHLIVQKYRNHIWVLSERTVRRGGRLGIDGQSTVSSTRNEKQKSHDREQMLNEGSSAYGVKEARHRNVLRMLVARAKKDLEVSFPFSSPVACPKVTDGCSPVLLLCV